jgi:L-lysine exporter family protein LysE/ArgO
MINVFFNGFILGITLIVAIGAQNAFVLRQGIMKQHVFIVALFCSVSDAFLICLGSAGISFFLKNFISEFSDLLFGLSSLWLFGYGFIRLKNVFNSNYNQNFEDLESSNLKHTLSTLVVITFANPHVYLDTMVLIGSISQQFNGASKIIFAAGASSASLFFFFSLAYGAKLIQPIMQNPSSWKILDFLIAMIMFSIALNLASTGNWI